VLPHLKKAVNMVLEQYIAQDFNAHLVVMGIPSFSIFWQNILAKVFK
jgi:hypothetical protein